MDTGATTGTAAAADAIADKAVAPLADTRTDADKAALAEQRDAAGATLNDVGDGDLVVGKAPLTVEPAPELATDGWEDVLVVAGAPGKMPPKKDRRIIVAEHRTPEGEFAEDATYPKNADAYIGHAQVDNEGEARKIFPDAGAAPVFLIGQNIRQFGFGGVSRQPGYVSVGPGSSIVAAVNLALLQGAKTVEVSGLSEAELARVGPWLEKIKGEFESLTF